MIQFDEHIFANGLVQPPTRDDIPNKYPLITVYKVYMGLIIKGPLSQGFSRRFESPAESARPRSDAGGRSGAVRRDGFDASYVPRSNRSMGLWRWKVFFIPKNVVFGWWFQIFVCSTSLSKTSHG